MRVVSLLLVALAICSVSAKIYFEENFENKDKWVQSSKDGLGEFVLSAGQYYEDENNTGLKTSQDAKFYDISAEMDEEFDNKDKDMVVQYTVKHEQGIDCGGGYLKLVPAGLDQEKFDGDSEYSIMFGPDICGFNKKIHLIINYKGKNYLWKKEPTAQSDTFTHIYTMILRSDNTYEVRVDNKKVESGSLFEDWDILPPKMIKDPSKPKPADWVDEKEIADPEDTKPEDWDQPAQIPDPNATKPEDWDEEDDGEWEAPMIDNPEYKGEWKPKMIPNPEYKGEYVQPEIENPEYNEDPNMYNVKPLKFVGIDLWQVKSGTIFDDILITDSVEEAEAAVPAIEARMAAEKKMKEDEDAAKKAEEEAKKAAEEEEKKAEENVDEKLDELKKEAAKDEL